MTVYYGPATRDVGNPEIVNLQNVSNWLMRHDRADSLVRFLARLPRNPAHKAFFW